MDNEEFLEICVNDYDTLMEDTFFSAKSVVELDSRHEQIKSEILEELPRKWRNKIGAGSVPETVRKQLNLRLDSALKKLKRHFVKTRQQEKSKLSALTASKDAIFYYNDEMEKYFQNHPNASPKEIEMNHVKVASATLALAKSKVGAESNAHLLVTLRLEIEQRRRVYFERAEMILQSNRDPAIGIDLGTTMCCVMVFYKGKCELVPNRSQGNSHTTPSYVAFLDDKTDTFGYVAKEEAYKYPETTIYDAKRMIGRPYSDEKLQHDIKKWPFEVVCEDGNPKVRTWGKLRYPHEISARLLTRLRLMAEAHLKLPRGSITKAVITVPAYFTEPQRRATNQAAVCAGLDVLNILSEPTAAAIAYSWERRDTGSTRRALIYDLGGGTFDCAIAKVNQNDVEILCVDGDTHLGGQDFDQLLMDYCIEEFKKTEGIDLAALRDSRLKTIRDKVRGAISRIKLQCEKAKERLTTTDTTTIDIEKLCESQDLSVVITKKQLENMVRPLVQTTLDIVQRALIEGQKKGIMAKADIDDVILVGGSTRMPIVMEMIQSFFGGKELCKHINPDEAVAYGAAIQAAIINKNDIIKNIHVEDVTPMSLGTDIEGDIFSVVIPKNSKIPCTFSRRYITVHANQTAINFPVYQGENPVASLNEKIGEFCVNGFPPKPAGEEEARVTMNIDTMGILHVKAVSITTGIAEGISISAERIGMDNVTINRLREECQQIKTF